MDQRTNDAAKSRADEEDAEGSIEEFKQLSGQGNSQGRSFNREEIHQRE
jgi:hypothetical protein